MNAKPRDAQAGWKIFRESDFSLNLNDLNGELTRRDFNPVSERTYNHYRKLERYGYQRYVPINQLDVETLRNPVWDTPLRSRYRPRPAELTVQLTFRIADDLVTIEGQAAVVSETEIVVKFKGARPWSLIQEIALENSHALVNFANTQEARSAIIELVEKDETRHIVTVTLSFLTMMAAPRLERQRLINSAHASFWLTSEGSMFFANAIRELFAFFQAVDSARMVCDAVLVDLDPDRELVFPPPEIKRLHLGSPMQLDLIGGEPYIVLVLVLFRVYAHVWQEHQKGAIDRQRARALRIRNDDVEFRNRLKRADLVRYVIQLVTSSLPPDTKEAASRRQDQVTH